MALILVSGPQLMQQGHQPIRLRPHRYLEDFGSKSDLFTRCSQPCPNTHLTLFARNVRFASPCLVQWPFRDFGGENLKSANASEVCRCFGRFSNLPILSDFCGSNLGWYPTPVKPSERRWDCSFSQVVKILASQGVPWLVDRGRPG